MALDNKRRARKGVELVRQQCRRITLITLATSLTTCIACAPIGLRAPTVDDQVLKTRTEHRPVEGEVVSSVDSRQTTATVSVLQVCETYQVQDIRRTSTQDRYNKGKSGTWIKGLSGVALTGVGVGLMVDAGSVYPKDEASREYNPTGQGTAYAYSGALIAGGLVLGTLAVIDAIRSQGHAVAVKEITETSEPISRGACPGKPASGVEVQIAPMASQGSESFSVGQTDSNGTIVVDLGEAIPSTYRWPQKEFEVWVNREVVSTVSGQAVFVKREVAVWEALDKETCRVPRKSTDCNHVQDFVHVYPDGPHALGAKRLLRDSDARRNELAEAEAWAAITSEDERVCLNRVEVGEIIPRPDCSVYEAYLRDFPEGKHKKEVEGLLAKSAASAEKREAKARTEAENERKREEAAMLAERRREEAAQKQQCLARCNVGCTSFKIDDKAMCRSGCSMRCSGNECEGGCAIGCSSFTVDAHQSCFANCKTGSCQGGY